MPHAVFIQHLQRLWLQTCRHTPTHWQQFKHFAVQVRQRMRSERATQTAGSLTYTTVLALVPLATIMLAIFTAFPAFDKLRLALENYFIESLMPRQVASVVTSYITLFASKARTLSLLGAAFLGVTVIAMFITIERSLNAIWQAPQRQAFWRRWLVNRLTAYWAVLTLAPFVLGASFYATGLLVSSMQGLGSGVSAAGHFFMFALPIALSSALWALVFKTLPNAEVRWQHAWIGAIVSSVLLAILKELFVVYLAKYANFKELYGAFSVVPVLLIWVYLAWWLTLFGATVAALLPSWGTRYAASIPQALMLAPLFNPLRVLRALHHSQLASGSAGAMSEPALQADTELSATTLLQTLRTLHDLTWVGKLNAQGEDTAQWVLLTSLDTLTMSPLLTQVFGTALAGTVGSEWAQHWVALGQRTVTQGMVILEGA